MGRSVSRAWEFQVGIISLALIGAGMVLRLAFDGVSSFLLGVGAGLLAFGLIFEAYGRVMGALAARDEGDNGWAVACAVVGSPALLAHAHRRRGDPIELYAGAVVGLLALVAVFTLFYASAATGLKGP